MIDLTARTGISLKFDPKTLNMKLGEGVSFLREWSKSLSTGDLWKSLKLGSMIKEKDLVSYNAQKDLYRGFQGAFFTDQQERVSRRNIRPDITAMFPGTIGKEFLRTEGHEHLSGFPEIYETVFGKNGYLLFKTDDNDEERRDIEDIMFVVAEQGDHVLFPPGYQHITVNLGKTGFLMTDWVSPSAQTDFKYIKEHNGAPCWVVKDGDGFGFEKNPSYSRGVPAVRVVKPAEVVPELGIKKGQPMFCLDERTELLLSGMLNDPTSHDFYKQAFVDI